MCSSDLLFAAQQMNSIESAQRALAILEQAEAPMRAEVLENPLLHRLVLGLRELVPDEESAGAVQISSWADLFSSMMRRPTWVDAAEVATHGATEWGARTFIDDVDADGRLAALFDALLASEHPQVDSIVPHLLAWFWRCRREEGGPSFGHLGVAVARHLGRPNSPAVDLRVLCTLVEDFAEIGRAHV